MFMSQSTLMKRTTIYLEPDMEVALKLRAAREGKSMVEVIREALQAHLARAKPGPPPGMGEFASGHADTAARFDALLEETGFGAGSTAEQD